MQDTSTLQRILAMLNTPNFRPSLPSMGASGPAPSDSMGSTYDPRGASMPNFLKALDSRNLPGFKPSNPSFGPVSNPSFGAPSFGGASPAAAAPAPTQYGDESAGMNFPAPRQVPLPPSRPPQDPWMGIRGINEQPSGDTGGSAGAQGQNGSALIQQVIEMLKRNGNAQASYRGMNDYPIS